MMNKQWIIASNNVAERIRELFQLQLKHNLENIEYLDLMGLYETGWIVYPHHHAGHDFGYPRNE